MNPSLSIWLDACRVAAALAVYVGHSVWHQVAPVVLSSTWHRSADDAVIAFFVISGLVIAHTAQRAHGNLRDYALARASRVYSVALPAVLLALVIDLIGMRLAPALYTPDWQYPKLWLYLPLHWLFLGETWFGAIYPFTIAPYWSLGYEVWYYALFGAMFFLRSTHRVVVVVVLLAVMGPRIWLLLPTWWLGVWLYPRVLRWVMPTGGGRTLMLLSVLGYFAYFLSGLRSLTDNLSLRAFAALNEWLPWGFVKGSSWHALSDQVIAALFAVFVVGCTHCGWSFGQRSRAVVRSLADHTFSFYLIHFTLLVFARAAGVHRPGWGGYAALLLATLAVTWALAQVGERRRHVYRRAFELLLDRIKLLRRDRLRAP